MTDQRHPDRQVTARPENNHLGADVRPQALSSLPVESEVPHRVVVR